MEFDIKTIIDEIELVRTTINNGEENPHLDMISIIKDMVLSRLDKNSFEMNVPKVVSLKNIKPEYEIVVRKVRVDDKILLLGTELVSI